jgi:hypothetical protein
MGKRSTKTALHAPVSSKPSKSTGKHQITASEAADQVLHLYRETFRDLARYDRGENPLDTISH